MNSQWFSLKQIGFILCLAIISCKPHATEPTITETVNKNDPRWKWTGVYECRGTYSIRGRQGETTMTVEVKMNGDTGTVLSMNKFNVKLDTVNNQFVGSPIYFPENEPYLVGGQFFRSLEVDSIFLSHQDLTAGPGLPIFIEVNGKKIAQ